VIAGILVQPLREITDDRGKVMHMLRVDAPFFKGFGEVYFSVVNPGAVKAWKRHLKITQHLAVPMGKIRLVVYDDQETSLSFKEVLVMEIGEGNYSLVRIPPLLWYGFQGLSDAPALVANCTDIPYDPNEVERLDPMDRSIPFIWGKP
jgi:dTDP-4-dehydrorhamnose 3,5-epimerase